MREIARQLGVSLQGGSDPTPKLVAASVAKVKAWCEQLGPVSSFDDLIEVVAAKLKVHFDVVRSDRDLLEVQERYLTAGETGFLKLTKEFDEYTDAVVIRLQKAPSWSDKQYVAVIDSRGTKKSREWFSQWHELAHLIAEPQTKFAFRRTQITRRDPVERLMDQIAGELAFYPALLLPMLEEHGVQLEDPTLAALVDFHDSWFSFASVMATLIAVLRNSATPCILVEARNELKVSEQRELAQGTLLPDVAPEPRLRATTTTHNAEAIRRKFYIHRWMRVPDTSVIKRVHDGDVAHEKVAARENLSWWESQGEKLPNRAVIVEAMRAGSGRVLALVKKA
jgi:hypothetical protein